MYCALNWEHCLKSRQPPQQQQLIEIYKVKVKYVSVMAKYHSRIYEKKMHLSGREVKTLVS